MAPTVPKTAQPSRRDAVQRGVPAAKQPGVTETPAPDAAGGEQVWERTHLEQTMFTLAREHAEAAGRCARQTPPDHQGEQTHSLVAVLMSFLALEAFINMVGADRLGPRFRFYDRMPPEGKWAEVTRLVSKTGKTFDDDGPEMIALSTLRTWRNMLTHYKGEYEDVQRPGRGGETSIEALLSAENAARAVESARILYRVFYEFDRRSPPRQFIWLDDKPHRRQQAGLRAAVPGAKSSARLVATAPGAARGAGGARVESGQRQAESSPHGIESGHSRVGGGRLGAEGGAPVHRRRSRRRR